MVNNLSAQYSLLSDWIRELRDQRVQQDRMRFRHNLERIGEVVAIEISKLLNFHQEQIDTTLGKIGCNVLSEQPVLATILRAGLPLHNGLLRYFDKADNAFISAFRKHNQEGSFEISLDYVSCPSLDNRVLILSDPMLATGASIVKTLQFLRQQGRPSQIHVVTAIACTIGIELVQRNEPTCTIWCGAVDNTLSPQGFIVPGLGDAGDLAFGTKTQT